MEPPKHRPRRKESEPLLNQVLNGAEAQRQKRKALNAVGHRRAIEVERNGRPGLGPPGREQPHGSIVEAPHGITHHQRGGGVEPLHVVNRDHERAGLGERSEHGEQRERDTLLVGRVVALVIQQERHLERVPVARRKLVQGIHVVSQQVAEGRVREARLRLRGASAERSGPRLLRARQRRLPDRRLTGAGLALDHECPRRMPGGLEEELHALELLLSSNEP